MFGLVTSLLSNAVSIVFPVVASYKALHANDIALLRPWLMYWVVLGLGTTAESYMAPVLRLVPLYGFVRLGALLWLVLPTTQGAVVLYTEHVEPYMKEHEHTIDGYIASGYEYVRANAVGRLLRLAETEPVAAPEPAGLTEMLWSRFRAPVPAVSDITSLISSWRTPKSSQEITEQRSQLLALVSSLDRMRNDADHDGYDMIDRPPGTPPSGTGLNAGSAAANKSLDSHPAGASSTSSAPTTAIADANSTEALDSGSGSGSDAVTGNGPKKARAGWLW